MTVEKEYNSVDESIVTTKGEHLYKQFEAMSAEDFAHKAFEAVKAVANAFKNVHEVVTQNIDILNAIDFACIYEASAMGVLDPDNPEGTNENPAHVITRGIMGNEESVLALTNHITAGIYDASKALDKEEDNG